jgi:hypothetical protein
MRGPTFFFVAVYLALITGCAGYRLGPTNGAVAGEKSIQINPFQNRTVEPRLSEGVTSALRKRLQQDGTYRLETHGDADIVVNGIIIKFDRSELSFQPRDILTPRDYTVAITAQIVAIERRTGKTNLNRLVYGQSTVRVGADLASAERQAVPLMAADLAKNAAAMLVDGTW